MRRYNDLLDATREQRFIDRVVDRVLIACMILMIGALIGAAAFGNP